jgi:hypothetical protein
VARRDYKPPKDPRGGHMRVYWDIFDSHAWACLGASSQLAYLALLRQKGSTNNGDLSLPITYAKRHGISSTSTLAKALRELQGVGLIAVTREGGCKKGGQRLPTLYRLTDSEVLAVPAKFIEAEKATNDWKAITSLGLGREALRKQEAEAATSETARKTKRLLRNSNATASEIEVVEPITASKFEAWTGGPVRNSKQAINEEKPGNPMLARVSA